MSHGVDVNKTRLDDLDRIILRDSLAEPFVKKAICNIGCGESSLSLALSGLGHKVYNYDSRNLYNFFDMSKELFQSQQFMQVQLEDIKKHNIPKNIEMVVLQRVLHYVSYTQAIDFLTTVTNSLQAGGSVYLSLTGVDSQIGREYTAKKEPIESRMGNIGEQDGQDFNITEPVCLYSEKEAVQLISNIDGLRVEKKWISQFGNIKMVMRKE